MMKSLKAFFLGRLLREKILLVAFILLGALIWLSGYSKRAGAFWRQQSSLKTTLAIQESWLNKRASIAERAQAGLSKLDPSKTLNDTRLTGEIGSLVRDAGIEQRNYSTAETRTERGPQFAVHSLRLTVNRSSQESLQKLYEELNQHSPYIGIEEFSIQVDPQTRNLPLPLLNYQIKVSSVEIPR